MSARRPLTIVILIDALGWEIAEHFDFARDLLPNRGALETVLGYSSAAIPSLMTGTPPQEHGAWAMFRYSPDTSPFRALRALPALPHALEWRTRALTRWFTDKRGTIKGYYDLYEIPVSVLGYFDVAEHGDPYTPGGLKQETLFDRLKAGRVPFKVWTYRTAESDNFAEMYQLVDSDDELLFLYTPELDALMHDVGTRDARVGERLRLYEHHIRKLLDRARDQHRDTSLYLFSDHGMTDVHTVVDVKSEVESWGLGIDDGVMAFYDSTMARFWCDGEARARLVNRLNETGWGHVISEDEMDAHGCRFDDDTYGNVIFLIAPGFLIVPSFMGRQPLAAMHGYHPDDADSKGCFLTVEGLERPRSIMDLKSFLLERIVGG